MKKRIIKELQGLIIKSPNSILLKFSFKNNILVKNAELLSGKKDMRRKVIKSDDPTYKKTIIKGLNGLQFSSYTALPNYNIALQIDNPFDEYNYPSTISKEMSNTVEMPLQPTWVRNITPHNSNISFEQLAKEENLPIKITSGYRGKTGFRGGMTVNGTRSNHNRLDENGNPLAYDIVPTNGNFTLLMNSIYNNPRVVQWFKDKGWGILDETNPTTMAKTGATGKHLHIGPDTIAVLQFNNRIARGLEGLKFVNYTAVDNPTLDTSTIMDLSLDNSPSLNMLDEIIKDSTNSNISEEPVTSTADYIGDIKINLPKETLDIYHKFGLTGNKYKEFADIMTPIFKQALIKNGYSTSNIDNLVKLAALESGYGLSSRGSKGYNLGGIKYVGLKGYNGSEYSDGSKYVDFNNLSDYADYYVRLLNNKYNALSAYNLKDFVNRLHGNNPTNSKYSTTNPNQYANALNSMQSLNKYLS